MTQLGELSTEIPHSMVNVMSKITFSAIGLSTRFVDIIIYLKVEISVICNEAETSVIQRRL